ncbi:MAG TPA: type II toxin-antitoxin system PemK/MazF family toxin [Candidatus Limnocylindrales bacterium]|jgi:mRNA interferase MazF
MRRGDIHIVDFEPARGSEVDKRRPAIIVSNDASNAIVTRLGRGLLTVVPLTTNIARLYKFQVLLPAARTGLDSDSKAQAEQVRSVGVERVGDRIGLVPYSLLDRVDEALRIHLDLG